MNGALNARALLSGYAAGVPMDRRIAIALFGLLMLIFALPVQAASCKVGFAPKTSGFVLNPTLDRLTVTSVEQVGPSDDCKLQVGDEILQVNDRKVPGSRALSLMKYWKALDKATPITFLVKRDGHIVAVVTG